AWEALERAGIDPVTLRGSQTGVFTGVMYNDYASRLHHMPAELEGYLTSGSAGSVASGRVAYTLGLEGPAVTVDTACSSSLVAVHLAIQALRNGECTLALAGGVTVMATPNTFIEFSRQRGLSADGRCKAFSADADGTGWSEGAGLLLLEKLSDARRNGHHVLASVSGSAMNQDGASNGLTAPNGPAQERVIRQALASARLEPSDVDVVEAHGTGTKLGDPIEAQAILATYGQNRPAEHPLHLGSLKSNIGHTQAAAGVAGVIKMVMAMHHGTLPQTLHADTPSPHIDWTTGAVNLLTRPHTWTTPDNRPRRAAVSSFGISGTNAHLILEQPAPVQDTQPAPDTAGPTSWVLSAKGENALRDQAHQLHDHLTHHPDLTITEVARALALTRTHFPDRAVITGTHRDQLLDALATLSRGEPAPGIIQGHADSDGQLAFLFAGQGSQRTGMGHELHQTYPVFAEAFDAVCAATDPHLQHPLHKAVFEDSTLLDRTEYTQPALFALETALYHLITSWGITPHYLTGHSIGEITAAHVAGVLSLTDAATLVTLRGRLMQHLPPGGAMMAIHAPTTHIQPLLDNHNATIAAINSPTNTVISGTRDALTHIAQQLGTDTKTRFLNVSHAFHSPLMEPMLDEFRQALHTLTYHPPTIPIISTLTGTTATTQQLTDPEHWINHARQAVLYHPAIQTLHNLGTTTYLELGPDTTLTTLTQQTTTTGHFIPTLRKNHPEPHTTTNALAHLHTTGTPINWHTHHRPTTHTTPLPTYPFQRQRHWLDTPDATGDATDFGLGTAGHPLLSADLELVDGKGHLFTGRLSLRSHPWLADHAIQGTAVLPGTAYVDLALCLGARSGHTVLEELTLEAPLVVPEQSFAQVQVVLGEPDDAGCRQLTVHSRPGGPDESDAPWTRHAVGLLARPDREEQDGLSVSADWPPAGAQQVPVEEVYELMSVHGQDYGPGFRGLTSVWRAGDELFAEVRLPEGLRGEEARFAVHPALLDAALHPLGLQAGDGGESGGTLRLPFAWSGVRLHAAGAASARLRISPVSADSAALTLMDAEGKPVVSIDSLTLRPVDVRQLLSSAAAHRNSLFDVEWVPVPTAPAASDRPAGGPTPVVVSFGSGARTDEDAPASLHHAAQEALRSVQQWLAEERDDRARLVFVTHDAVAAAAGDGVTGLDVSPVWGLVRTAQSEHPDRFVLLDTDTESLSPDLITTALATGEPQLALRNNTLLAPRLKRADTTTNHTPHLDPNGTILITGGTGTLGSLLARHLVTEHGARHLLLVSRSGPNANGATELTTELTALGAHTTITACDVADPDALTALLTTIPDQHPLTTVIHTAGTTDDTTLETLTPHQLDTVLHAKADAARNLHHATRNHHTLTTFILYSSIAGTLGNAGQANYAAANTYLDALAHHRHTQGLPATSLAWGLWEETSALTQSLGAAERARIGRSGILPIASAAGLKLFDASLARGAALSVPVLLDMGALRNRAAAGELAPLYRELVPVPAGPAPSVASPAGGEAGVREQLLGIDDAERERFLDELVRRHVADVLGHASPSAVEPRRGLLDMGLDSLSAVELRNRLGAATGLRLSTTLVFDYPTPVAITGHLLGRLAEEMANAALSPLDALEAAFEEISGDEESRSRTKARLEALLSRLTAKGGSGEPDVSAGFPGGLDAVADEDLFEFIDNDLD
ncbi:SDR family NAD(P)-dependent oxidoreductase, partial [Kitasatospora sp. NPDC093102]|uniref:type I polyketide synthase n=1 Tax=Kitasatospora sp. NPDC093102 TaxID=3155069 RepID=UPI003416D6D5